MIRCLNCQQSKQFRFGGRDGDPVATFTFNDTNTKVIEMLENDVDRGPDAHAALENVLKNQNDGEIVCAKCDEELSLMDARNAFNEPGQFFDAENLCHCGGELWMDNVPGTKNYAFVCEKCDWVKPRVAVSGA